MYTCVPSVYTLAVIGYRLYRVQQPYGAQPDSWECGLRYRNRALSNPIPFHLVLRFATAFFRFPPSFRVLSSTVDALFVQSTLLLSSLRQQDLETCSFDVVMQVIRYGYSVSQPSLINHLLSFISSQLLFFWSEKEESALASTHFRKSRTSARNLFSPASLWHSEFYATPENVKLLLSHFTLASYLLWFVSFSS